MTTNTPSKVLLYRVDGHKTSLVHRFQLIDLNPKPKPIEHLISEEIHVITLPEYLPISGLQRIPSIMTIRQGSCKTDEYSITRLVKWIKDDIPAVFGIDVVLYQVGHTGVTILSHAFCANPGQCPGSPAVAGENPGENHPQSHFQFDIKENKFVVSGYSFVKGRVIYSDAGDEKKCGWTGWNLDLKDGQTAGDFDGSKFDLGARGLEEDEALVKRALELSKSILTD